VLIRSNVNATRYSDVVDDENSREVDAEPSINAGFIGTSTHQIDVTPNSITLAIPTGARDPGLGKPESRGEVCEASTTPAP
jgi:hypothetical protein